jgi:hypothetical protein
MVWSLLLAHFLGDFVFQSDWMVRNRDKLWVLSLHASTHFVLMFFFMVQLRLTLWPYLLLIALIHFGQDRIKIILTNRRPEWIQQAFIIDQALHFATIWAVARWIQISSGPFSVLEKPVWVIVAIGYLAVTYVWFISERVFNLANMDYLLSINNTKFPRMLARAGLVSVFLLFRNWSFPGLAMVLSNPYPPSKFRQRALLTDVGVSLFAVIFILGVLR